MYLDKEIEQYLLSPLKNTSLPPHFCGLADKSRIHRVTNQGVVICTVLNGCRTAIAVQAPIVYSGGEDDSHAVAGACAPELAENMFKTIKHAYVNLTKILCTSWQGNALKKTVHIKGNDHISFYIILKVLLRSLEICWESNPLHFLKLYGIRPTGLTWLLRT